jgi:hypothetical protein
MSTHFIDSSVCIGRYKLDRKLTLLLWNLVRSDAAWRDANYAALWEFLREEYELDERFESFDFKLEIIQVPKTFSHLILVNFMCTRVFG